MAFIALEGGEGFGKSTQVRLLQERLPDLFPDKEFVFTREPGGTPLAELIRSVLFSKEASDANGLTLFGLFASARADHVRRVIRPRHERGEVVISDRFAGSSFAYQAYAEENPIPEALFKAHCDSIGILPDLTLIFDMDPEVALQRVSQRYGEKTHFDARELDFHQKLREGYLRYAEILTSEGRAAAIVPADREVEEVFNFILKEVQSVI